VYDHIATPSDLNDYNFEVVGDNEYVRRSDFERVYDVAELADEAITSIESSILDLCNDMTVLDELGEVTTVTITASI
jgi:hypothetical protein